MGGDDERDIVRRFFSYRASQIQGLVDAVRDVIEHGLTKGIEAEQALADLLRCLLPGRYSSSKGFLLDTKGKQSNEFDLIIVDRLNTARLFDFSVFELVPIEAALACIEVKTTLTKHELDDTFDRFQKVQEMEFFEERVLRFGGQGLNMQTAQTSRPELILFAYEIDGCLDRAIRKTYETHPSLEHAKVCVLNSGIVGWLTEPYEGLGWVRPKEEDKNRFAGQVLALFLFQFLLPALIEQTKGQKFYAKYLEGSSRFDRL